MDCMTEARDRETHGETSLFREFRESYDKLTLKGREEGAVDPVAYPRQRRKKRLRIVTGHGEADGWAEGRTKEVAHDRSRGK